MGEDVIFFKNIPLLTLLFVLLIKSFQLKGIFEFLKVKLISEMGNYAEKMLILQHA